MRLWGRSKTNGESIKAIQDAESHVEQAKAREHEVHQIAESFRRIRERNHFAEQVIAILSHDLKGGAK